MVMNSLQKTKSFLDIFPTPEYLLLSASGVSINDENIRFVKFRRDLMSSCMQLVHEGKAAVPAGALANGFIQDEVKLATALSDLATRYGLRYVRATLPEEKAYLFTVSIEKVPFAGLYDAVAFIIEENVPVSLADSVFDFEVVKEVEDGRKIKVAVSVLPRKVVETYVSVFEKAGLVPVSFDIESQAIARAITIRGDKRTQLIVNLGKKKTGFYVVEDEVVQFTTTLAFGTTDTDQARSLNELKMELRKIFAFWNARVDKRGFPEGHIERVLICGEGALDEKFIKDFMSEISTEFNLADAWINTDCLKNDHPKGHIFKEGLTYAPAIGLALPRRQSSYV